MADYIQIVRTTFGKEKADIGSAIAVVGALMVLIVPIPGFLLDLLMIFNLFFGLTILLIVLYSKNPLEFSVFPTVLLVGTVFGLVLNIASTRLILSRGPDFNGQVVQAFARFVVGSEGMNGLVTGLILFIIIIVVQFMVITKGSTRISEVAARFALDAMPGKQMAIDAEFGSGAITEEEAHYRRRVLEQTSDFYGRMDGSTKFVSGNVKAGILITVFNILGGLLMGSLRGEGIQNSLSIYSSLTIGDGLVSQIPGLVISIATGLVVTRAGSEGSFGAETTAQFSTQPRVFFMGSLFLGLMALVPGFPWYILLPLALGSFYIGLTLRMGEMDKEKKETAAAEEPAEASPEISPIVPLDTLSIELGYGLIPLVDKDKGADLLDRITNIRRETALELGIVVPKIRIIDNMRLESQSYSLKIKGVEIGRGMIRLGSYLAINPGGDDKPRLKGENVTDPAFGLPAQWIEAAERDQAERQGYTVVDAPSIIATHLTELIRSHASELLGRQEVQSILDALKEEYSAAVEEVRKDFSVGDIQKVLQNLLKEGVSIRNMVTILETLADFGGTTKEISFLTEKVRQGLKRQISLHYADDNKKLFVITIAPYLEKAIIDSRVDSAEGGVPALDPDTRRAWLSALLETVRDIQQRGFYPVILCSEAARVLVRIAAERDIADFAVLSTLELTRDVNVEIVGVIGNTNQEEEESE